MSGLWSGQQAHGAVAEGARSKHQTNSFYFGIRLGFFAGLIWGLVRWMLYSIKFTKVIPAFLAEPFFRHQFLVSGWGHALGLGFFILFSIAATFLYIVVFGRLKGPWWGIIYGIAWWAVLMVAAGPLWGTMEPFNRIGYDTISTEFSVFVVWGLFIGYTIAFEFHDEASREPARPN
ncbi:YqhR family membrane protein [Paenibacillus sp. GCM10027626]|uniref:YqhR family membrane protein n=1 Tax=Paenibacillus sp. GCM10027626 TaxID=3273411 RepID=UPI00362AAF45